jgi:uncharacterized protein (DUF1501 family)
MNTQSLSKLSRRGFLNNTVKSAGIVGLSSALFPAWMPRMAFRRAGDPPGDVLVAVFQRGGMDALNAVVPFGEGRHYYDRRPTIAIPEPDGSDWAALDLDGFFGLHPAMKPIKEIYDNGNLAIVHGVGSPNNTRSHFDAMEYMERGTPGDKTTSSGWITRHLLSAAWENDSPFRAVGMGAILPTSLRGPVSALALRSITDAHLGGREDQLADIQRTLASLYSVQSSVDALGAQAQEVFGTLDMLAQLSASEYVPEHGAEYGDSEFGWGLRQVAQLIKAGVGLEVACLDIGGWDTHDNQGGVEGDFAYNLGDMAQGMAAFYTDLRDHMGNVTVVTMSEFGRTTAENASYGTDHGRGTAMFVMGGGAKSGVYTRWRGMSDDALEEGDLAVTVDFRDVLSEILTGRLANNAVDQIFPGYAMNPLGILTPR